MPKNKIIIVIYIVLLKQLVIDIINFCSELWLQMWRKI